MKRANWARAAAFGVALACSAAFAQTQTPADTTTATPGPGAYGPGMMRGYGGGYGPGMMRGYGAGMMGGGYGYGMMGACPGNGSGCYGGGYGPGMMGGYGRGMGGYGPGMMGGYGPGMMGGYGPGFGRGNDVLSQLDLTAEQQDKIAQIAEDARAKNWTTMGELRAEQFKLRSLYNAAEPDANAIAEQQRKVDALRRTLLKSRVEAHNRMASVLTKEQREQLRSIGPWWLDEETATD